MSEPDSTPPPGMTDSARNAMDSALGLMQKRLELAALELEEEKQRLLDSLFRIVVIAVLSLMALFMASFFVVLLCWETPARLWSVVLLSLGYAAGAWRGFVVLKRRLENSPTPFAATIEEFKKDREWFQK